jgi:TolA-binding protein
LVIVPSEWITLDNVVGMSFMSFADLHPEGLLEREVSGTLEARDRAQLERHLEGCEACRFERKLRKDFAEELADAEPLPAAAGFTQLLIQAALRPKLRDASSVRARLSARVTGLVAAAAICVCGSAAIGAALAGHLVPRLEEAPFPMTSPPSAPQAARSPSTETPTHLDTSAKDAPVPAPEIRDEVSPPPPPPERPPASAYVRTAPPLPTLESTAASLFNAENEARRQGDYVRALSLHHELGARFASSTEAQVSRAVMGRGLLDRGKAEEALACFDDYLIFGSGDLGEEVMAERATALERLERTDDARAAWQRLRETYPASSYASRATARLEKSL